MKLNKAGLRGVGLILCVTAAFALITLAEFFIRERFGDWGFAVLYAAIFLLFLGGVYVFFSEDEP